MKKNRDALIKVVKLLKDNGYDFLLVFKDNKINGVSFDANADVMLMLLRKLHLQAAQLFAKDDLQVPLMMELALAQKILALNSDITTEELKEIKEMLDDIPDKELIEAFNEKHDEELQVAR